MQNGSFLFFVCYVPLLHLINLVSQKQTDTIHSKIGQVLTITVTILLSPSV
jgi:hypothetical protein